MLAKQTYVFTCYSFDVLLSVYLQSLHFQILENLRDILLVLWALTCYFLNSQYSCVYLYLRQVFFFCDVDVFMVNIITAIGIRVKLDHGFFLTGQNLKKSHNVQSVAVPGWLILLERKQSRETNLLIFSILQMYASWIK